MHELPMFPLGTVLLPHMVLPLHIFEPRYREMIRDVLAGGQEFGVTLITRGREVGGGDQRADVGTVARVVQAEELDDGRWLVVGVGVRRLRVREWRDDHAYPSAQVEDLPDAGADVPPLPDGMVARLRRVLAMHAELGHDGVPATFELEDDPSAASWQVAVVAPLTPFDAQRVLEAPDGRARLALLDDLLHELEEVLALDLRVGGETDDT